MSPSRPGLPPPRHRGEPLWIALGAALALHASLLALPFLLPPHAPITANVGDRTRGDIFDIETHPADPPPQPASGAPITPAAAEPPPTRPQEPQSRGSRLAKIAPASKPSAIDSPTTPTRPEAPSSAPAPTVAPPGAGSTSGSTTPADDFPQTPSGPAIGVPGIDGRPVWALPGVLAPMPSASAAPTRAPDPRPTDSDIAGHVLSGALRKKDRELGLDLPAGGVVASTIASAVRGSEAPGDARATFEVRLGRDGKVLGVRVVSSTAGDASTWERVAKNAASSLASRALVMNGDAASKGATVTVKIESKILFPAGTKQKVDVQPVCAEEVIEDMARVITEGTAGEPSRGPIQDPAVNRPDPREPTGSAGDAADREAKRRFCIPIGVRGRGDLANTGAHAQTVVRSTYQVVVPGTNVLPDVKKVDTGAPWAPPDPTKVQRPKRKWPKKKKKSP